MLLRPIIIPLFLYTFFRVLNCHGDEEEHEDDDDDEKQMEKHMGVKFSEPIVIVISFDGFRYDYLDRLKSLKKNSVLWKLIRNGALYDVDGMTTTFTPQTFPNHYTLATGLYQENHGIIANDIYDKKTNTTYNLKQNLESSKFLYGGEPIWTTVQKKIPKVACYMWVGCQFGNLKYFVPWAPQVKWPQTVDQIVEWLNEGVQLMTVYWTEPDATGHGKGPNSFEMNQTLVEIDDQLEVLLNKINENRFWKKNVNFIFTSDHGMAEVVGNVTIPEKKDLYNVIMQETTFWHVNPEEGKLQETYDYFNQFKEHLEVYKKENIPENWHYKNNERIGEILVVAKLGYTLGPSGDKRGRHGYSPDYHEMRGFFVASGPAFKKITHGRIDIANTDLYLLICNIFDVTPAPNNGSQDALASILSEKYLKNPRSFPSVSTNLWIVAITSTAVVLFVFVVYFMHRSSYEKRKRRFNVAHLSSSSSPMNGGGTTGGFVYHKIPNEQAAPLLSNKTLEHAVDDSDNESI